MLPLGCFPLWGREGVILQAAAENERIETKEDLNRAKKQVSVQSPWTVKTVLAFWKKYPAFQVNNSPDGTFNFAVDVDTDFGRYILWSLDDEVEYGKVFFAGTFYVE